MKNLLTNKWTMGMLAAASLSRTLGASTAQAQHRTYRSSGSDYGDGRQAQTSYRHDDGDRSDRSYYRGHDDYYPARSYYRSHDDYYPVRYYAPTYRVYRSYDYYRPVYVARPCYRPSFLSFSFNF